MASVRSSTFGALLRRYRVAAGLTQEDLADRSGLSVRTISDLERGIHRSPQQHTVHRLADALDLAHDERLSLQEAGRRPDIAVAADEPPHPPVSPEEPNPAGPPRPSRGVAIPAALPRFAALGVILCLAILALLLFRLNERHNGAPAALASVEQGTFTPWGPPAGGSSPFVLPYGVAVDPAGDIYVADPGSNRVEKLSPTGQPLAQYGGTARGSIRLNGPSGVAVDSRGGVYVADTGNDRILKLLPDGGMAVVWERNLIPKTGLVVNNPLSRPLGVAVDRLGDIYAANTGGNTIASISSDGMSNAGMSAGLAGLNAPGGIAVDRRGTIYVADTGNHRIQLYSSTYTPVAQWGGEGSGDLQLDAPTGIAIDQQGNVYVADAQRNCIHKLSPRGKLLAEIGSTGTGPGQFQQPEGVAVDRGGDLYVADSGNARIQKLSAAGTPLAQWTAAGLLPPLRFTSPNAIAADGQGDVDLVTGTSRVWINTFSPTGRLLSKWPVNPAGLPVAVAGIAAGPGGAIYVVDELNNRVLVFSRSGKPAMTWSGDGAGGQFNAPSGVAVDPSGNVYVADSGNRRVLKLSPAGKPLARFGTYGFGPGQFLWPRGLAVDARNNVYVTDMQLDRVQEFSPAGRYLRSWGARGSGPEQFDGPVALAVDRSGAPYVVDEGNGRIQKLSLDGQHVTVWQMRAALSSQNADPVGVALDSAGHVYVADRANGRILRLTAAG